MTISEHDEAPVNADSQGYPGVPIEASAAVPEVPVAPPAVGYAAPAPQYAAPQYAAPQPVAPQPASPQYAPPAVPQPAPPQYAPPVASATLPVPPAPAPKKPRGFGSLLLASVLGGVFGAMIVAAAAGGLYYRGFGQTTPKQPVGAQKVTIVSDGRAQPVEAVASKLLPSVVNISVVQRATDAFGRGGDVEGTGSGVIIRPNGYILTNNHVIEGASKITVRIGTEEVAAKVIGADPSSDLAVVKVERVDLPSAQVGDSDRLKVGQAVVAIGSPFGLDKTVTSGIVSALHRSNLADDGSGSVTAYTNLIQTDASINPGNSGGALADMTGSLVGINTLIESPSGSVGAPQSAGIGFAIPIAYAAQVADQLIKTGKAEHPFMGVSTSDIDEQTAQLEELPVKQGARVEEIVPGSPAESAGIRVGDIIVDIAGTPITGFEDVFTAIRAHSVGEAVDVTVVRDGSRETLRVTLGSDAGRK